MVITYVDGAAYTNMACRRHGTNLGRNSAVLNGCSTKNIEKKTCMHRNIYHVLKRRNCLAIAAAVSTSKTRTSARIFSEWKMMTVRLRAGRTERSFADTSLGNGSMIRGGFKRGLYGEVRLDLLKEYCALPRGFLSFRTPKSPLANEHSADRREISLVALTNPHES